MSTYNPDSARFNLYSDIVSSLILLTGFGASVLGSAIFILWPHNPIAFTAILPDAYFWYFCPILMCLHVQISSFVYQLLSLCSVVIFNVGAIVSQLGVREYYLGQRGYRLVDEVRQDISVLVHQYRSIEIFSETGMLFIGKFLVPFQSVFMVSTVFCNSMLIKQWDRMQTATKVLILFWAFGCTTVWSLILVLGGYLHKHGKSVLVSWKNHDFGTTHRNKLMKRVARSCRPVMLNYGNCFVIRKGSVLKFLRSVSRGTLRALLVMLRDQ